MNTIPVRFEKQNKRSAYLSLLVSILIFSSFSVTNSANDLRKVVSLEGYWHFSIGDYAEWSDPNYNDSDWDDLRVPGKWEDQGYNSYNGFAWYRKKFKMYSIDDKLPIYLLIGRIDDVDEVYLNGKLLAGSGSFPTQFYTAYNLERKYLIPRELLNTNGTNTIAVRVFDDYYEGGIVSGPVGIYIDESYNYLNYAFRGKWKFHLGDNHQWKSPGYDDNSWDEIDVPSAWEQKGYANYDGYAWYRKKFQLPANLKDQKLYISLGKIDDEDHVYLNGHLIGSVFDLEKDGEYKRKGFEYNARRIYPIPADILNRGGDNIIAIRVYDGQSRGGIYEGPLGLMTVENYKQYRRKHYSNQPFWDYVIDEFIDN